ncbi:MAG: hypothetical protein JRF07_07675 [Deltaproteobacteria bacterium]|nr:hypothetical protein [Deltaproteobacteria bacterium]
MSNSPKNNSVCQDADHHDLHICQLSRKGLREEIARRTNAPEFLCHNCNVSANREEDLCNPSRLSKPA